jgi:hypothetical protein
MANTKKTRDRAAQTASHLLRTSADPAVLSVAASALAQSDPLPDKRRPRGSRARVVRKRVTAQFKAGKDLITDEPAQEGGGTE